MFLLQDIYNNKLSFSCVYFIYIRCTCQTLYLENTVYIYIYIYIYDTITIERFCYAVNGIFYLDLYPIMLHEAIGFFILSLYDLVSLSANRGLLLQYVSDVPENVGEDWSAYLGH